MESARDKRTGEIVEAEDLWLLEDVDTSSYVAGDVGLKCTPQHGKKEVRKTFV
ncbi:hypothetical protein [Serratia marcescens]|uniref:hypothetical protein n=1 Tax=Serratia marcescens TaxID=615 RepID=UPI000DFAB8B9|nr:hypothetical protein [Serratia marcescens]SUJ37061.1 Uncharacterised protein [Serratia marcescens]